MRSRPPPVRVDDVYWPGRERRYSDLSIDQIPLTESLLDCMKRTRPAWEDKVSVIPAYKYLLMSSFFTHFNIEQIKLQLRSGRNVMVVAHANTLRGLVKLIDNIGDEEIQEVALPTGKFTHLKELSGA